MSSNKVKLQEKEIDNLIEEEEKAAVAQDITDILADSKIKGYDIKILKQIMKLRKMDDDKRMRQEEELETYKSTIGMK